MPSPTFFGLDAPLASVIPPTSFLDLIETATPATPASAHHRVYFKPDGLLYQENAAGVESLVSSGGGGGGSSITWRAAWNSSTTYAINDAVSRLGSAYIALAASTNIAPESDATKWGILASKGTDGSNGAAGSVWYQGAVASDNANGINGDFYTNTANYNYYQKQAGAWVLLGNLKGATGASGGAATSQNVAISVGALASGAQTTGTVTIAKGFTIQPWIIFDQSWRVRLYKTTALRTTDLTRSTTTALVQGNMHGCITDIWPDPSLSYPYTWEMSPERLGSNGDNPQTTTIYYTVDNPNASALASGNITIYYTQSQG